MKILHLIIDHQVIERTLSVYERVFPACNDVIVFSDNNLFKHLDANKYNIIISHKNLKEYCGSFSFNGYTHIVAHYLTFEMIDFIMSAPKDIHVCWEIYGADLYNQFLLQLGYPLQYVDSNRYSSRKVAFLKKTGLFNLSYAIKFRSVDKFGFVIRRYFDKITNRINSVAVCCKGDGTILEKYSGRKYKIYRAFNYSLTETLGDLLDSQFSTGNDLMIGNSASLTNNHLYVLKYIKDIPIDYDNIIVPVSYGGKRSYIEDVIGKYGEIYSDKMVFLRNYMPLSEYNKIFLRLKTMVLASWRQESIGTIFMGLYLGIKIYMSNKSPLFQSLLEEGFVLFDIENVTKDSFAVDLSEEQKNMNRSLLLKNYGEGVFEKELVKQFI